MPENILDAFFFVLVALFAVTVVNGAMALILFSRMHHLLQAIHDGLIASPTRPGRPP